MAEAQPALVWLNEPAAFEAGRPVAETAARTGAGSGPRANA